MTTNGNGLTQHTIDHQPEIVNHFRRCHMIGCLGVGNWTPVISVSPDKLQWGHLPLRLLLVCDHHKDIIGLDDLLYKPIGDGRSAWEVVVSAFTRAGKDAPLKEFTQLRWQLG